MARDLPLQQLQPLQVSSWQLPQVLCILEQRNFQEYDVSAPFDAQGHSLANAVLLQCSKDIVHTSDGLPSHTDDDVPHFSSPIRPYL